MLPFLVILSLVLLVSIEILISMSMFWTIESFGINFLRMQLQQLSRWPDFIFKNMARKVFTYFIPVLLVGSVPVKVLLGERPLVLLLSMVAACMVLWPLIYIFWRLGLRKYESASS